MSQPADAAAIKEPWSPLAIAILTLVFSPMVGGVLHGLNCERLGRPGFQRFVLSRNLVASAGTIFIPFLLGAGTSFGFSGASLFFAAYFYKTQERLFQDHLSQGGEKGSLLVAILWAILVTIPMVILSVILSLAIR